MNRVKNFRWEAREVVKEEPSTLSLALSSSSPNSSPSSLKKGNSKEIRQFYLEVKKRRRLLA